MGVLRTDMKRELHDGHLYKLGAELLKTPIYQALVENQYGDDSMQICT